LTPQLLLVWRETMRARTTHTARHGALCVRARHHAAPPQVNPNIRRDKWTAEEDAKLMELVKTFGIGRWAEIARNCEGRTDQQCMGRWRRHLDPGIKRVRGARPRGCGQGMALDWAGCRRFTTPSCADACLVVAWRLAAQDAWTREEDAKLRQLHAQYGTSWSRISKNLRGRTSQQCRARWHQLNNTRSSKSAAGSSGGSGNGEAAGGSGSGSAAAAAAGGGRSTVSCCLCWLAVRPPSRRVGVTHA
jgi:myb proto-oncogene protein